MSQVIFACFKSMVTAHLPASRLPVSNGLPMKNRAIDVSIIRYGEKSISDGVPGVCWDPLIHYPNQSSRQLLVVLTAEV